MGCRKASKRRLFRPVAPGDPTEAQSSGDSGSQCRKGLRVILLKGYLSTNTPSVGALTLQHCLPVQGPNGSHSQDSPQAVAVGTLNQC